MNRKLRTLLIEDNQNQIRLNLIAFQKANYNGVRFEPVQTVQTGQAALDVLIGRSGSDLPQIIFLDLKLNSEIEGLEILKQVKANGVARRVPIVVLTTSREDADRCYDLGAWAYVVKPLRVADLVDILKRIAGLLTHDTFVFPGLSETGGTDAE